MGFNSAFKGLNKIKKKMIKQCHVLNNSEITVQH